MLIAGFTLLLVVLIVLWYTAPDWEGPLGLGPRNSGPTQSFVSINVTQWTFSGPPTCWQGSEFSYGGIVPLAGTLGSSVALPYPGGLMGTDCTAQSVQITTSGFTLLGSNAPVTVSPGGSERLYVNVTVPNSTYTGPLAISVSVVSP